MGYIGVLYYLTRQGMAGVGFRWPERHSEGLEAQVQHTSVEDLCLELAGAALSYLFWS